MKTFSMLRFSILIIGLSALLLTSCHLKQADKELLPSDIVKNPNSANGSIDADQMPVLQFESDFHDFGRVIQGEKVSFGFKFTNTGKSDLIISNVTSSCGCTVPDFPKTPIKPGESHKIDVKFDSEGRRGFQNKTVTISSNTQPSTQVVRIKAEVILPEEIK
jgi:hypothetical protein